MTNVVEFLGRFHPLLLHLPIGIYVLAFGLQYLKPRKIIIDDRLMGLLLHVGLFTAVITSLLGWFLSISGGYAENDIAWHKWSAVFLVLISCLLSASHIFRSQYPWLQNFYHLCFMATLLLIIITGHFGGELTHGEGFLFKSSDSTSGPSATDSLSQIQVSDTSTAAVYKVVVAPIIRKKCENCHNQNKTKGGLRMDQYELLMKGGKHGKIIDPGDPLGSEMVKRILLEMNDDKHMPPKGKSQLSDKEIAVLYWWIGQGADATTAVNKVTSDTLKSFLVSSVVKESDVTTLMPDIKPADSTSLLSARMEGFTVRPVALSNGFLEVSAISMAGLKSEAIAKLKPIATNILWLNLSNHPVTGDELSVITEMKNIRKIDLRNSAISDQFLTRLNVLEQLEYLNLVGTNISDQGIATLEKVKNLKYIYCWNTKVTEAGVIAFQKKRPDVFVHIGALSK